jgi:aspartate aminotransferase
MGKMLDSQLPMARTVTPPGAFYYFVDMRPYLSKLKLDEEEFAGKLLKERGVAVIPGRFFGDNGRGHIRLTFVSESEERIELGFKKVADFISRGGS